MQFEEIRKILHDSFPDDILGVDENSTPAALLVQSYSIKKICAFLKKDDRLFFDSLSCLTGLDEGVESGLMEVIYNLYSIPYDHHLMLKASIDRSNARIDSVSSIWRTADWHERETFDLLGIHFNGHPDLRRILLPADWEGYPLRKDYVEQERYHSVKVKY
ncbi:MAG: NADH-quinone oxidoreductase subunit C [Bacteroidota bacterium]